MAAEPRHGRAARRDPAALPLTRHARLCEESGRSTPTAGDRNRSDLVPDRKGPNDPFARAPACLCCPSLEARRALCAAELIVRFSQESSQKNLPEAAPTGGPLALIPPQSAVPILSEGEGATAPSPPYRGDLPPEISVQRLYRNSVAEKTSTYLFVWKLAGFFCARSSGGGPPPLAPTPTHTHGFALGVGGGCPMCWLCESEPNVTAAYKQQVHSKS